MNQKPALAPFAIFACLVLFVAAEASEARGVARARGSISKKHHPRHCHRSGIVEVCPTRGPAPVQTLTPHPPVEAVPAPEVVPIAPPTPAPVWNETELEEYVSIGQSEGLICAIEEEEGERYATCEEP